MSFTAQVKDELSRLIPEHTGAQKAELAALIQMQGRVSGHYRLELSTETAAIARKMVWLLHNVYKLKTEVSAHPSSLHKSYSYLITIPAQDELVKALKDMRLFARGSLEYTVDPRLFNHPQSLPAYLRGAFLGGGFLSSPQADFHFEISCTHEGLANGIVALLASVGIPANSILRRNAWVVYLKGTEPITDFLTFTGAHAARLDIESVLVTKSLRNDVNRRLNAEMANQAKAIDASMEQIKAIRLLADKKGLDSLPAALRELASLRLEHPDASLRELGELATPPLSKSAVNHRVRRIAAIVQKLLGTDIQEESEACP
ncbi:MAG: DNA-binding protein WhiA [Coriobacteriia bacterium]|nr:DNA-binding protein WhiA [Coriobacteriia bacterium]